MSLRKDYMGRRIKHRADYRLDSRVLERLIEAVKADDTRPDVWRKRLAGHLSEALLMMLEDQKRLLKQNVPGEQR